MEKSAASERAAHQPVVKLGVEGPESELVRLRPLVAADHDGLYRVAADPLIWAQHPDPSRAHPPGFKIFFDKALESGGALAVIDRAEQKIIGTSRYHRLTSDDVMIGYTF